jgi:hypothetical protein
MATSGIGEPTPENWMDSKQFDALLPIEFSPLIDKLLTTFTWSRFAPDGLMRSGIDLRKHKPYLPESFVSFIMMKMPVQRQPVTPETLNKVTLFLEQDEITSLVVEWNFFCFPVAGFHTPKTKIEEAYSNYKNNIDMLTKKIAQAIDARMTV